MVEKTKQYREANPKAKIDKKSLHRHSTFGKIEVKEIQFKIKRGIDCPFSYSPKVYFRSYSRAFQKALTDFMAEGSFAAIYRKISPNTYENRLSIVY